MNLKLEFLKGLTVKELCGKYQMSEDEVLHVIEKVSKVKNKSIGRFTKVCDLYLEGMPVKDIAKEVGVSRGSVFSILEKYDLRIPERKSSLNEKDVAELITMYREGCTLTSISKRFGKDVDTIRYYLKREGVYVQKHFTNTMIDELINKFGSEAEDYYFLGFCLADGSVSKNRLIIELNERDEELLIKFRDKYHPNAEIKHRTTRPLSSLNFCTKKFVDKIRCMGLRENKRSVGAEIIPKVLYENKQFAGAFLLGYIDGDGQQVLNRHGTYSVGFTGCPSVVKHLMKLLDTHYKDIIYRTHSPATTYTKVNFNHQLDTLKFIDSLYSCSELYMDRKRNKWLKALKYKTKLLTYNRYKVTPEMINSLVSITENHKKELINLIP